MQEFLIQHSEKGFLSVRESVIRHIHERWKKIFKDCSRDESVLLENVLPSKQILENGTSLDIGGYDKFSLSIVRRVFSNLISKDLVSVQPIYTPTGKVFYLDPQIKTGLTQNYQSIYESHYDSKNYDISKGSYSFISGATSAITEINYNSGLTFNLPYHGGMDSIGSLRIFTSGNTYSDMISLCGLTTGTITGYSPIGLFVSGTAFDNDILNYSLILPVNQYGYMKFTFNSPPTTPVSKYSIYFVGSNAANSWRFCGSTNDSNWVLLDDRTSEFPTGDSYNYYIPTNISTPYQYYMITGITSPSNGVQINEFELMSGTPFSEQLSYTISPQTWGDDLLKSNLINVMVHQTGSSIAGTATAFAEWKDYSGTEGISTMQEMKLNVVSSDVETRTRKIKNKITEELLQDADAYFSMNVAEELSDLIGEEIAAEIDREIIGNLIKIAPYKIEWYYNMYALTSMTGFVTGNASSEIASAVTQYRWAQDSLLTAINKMDATIKKANIYHGANWLICSTRVGEVIETMKEHKAISGSKIVRVDRLRKTGKLKSSIDVYVDPYLPENICLLGYNGDNWDSGFIYAPYIIAAQNSTRDPDTLFEISTQFLTRYATKIITNKKYGLIDCKFSSIESDIIVNGV